MTKVSTACLILHHGKVLLAKRKTGKNFKGFYGCAGGKIEKGESPVDAIRREIKEETGLDVVNLQPLAFIGSHMHGDDHYICLWFVAGVDKPWTWDGKVDYIEKNKEGEPKTDSWLWYDPEDLGVLKLMPTTKAAFEFYDNNHSPTNMKILHVE
jgi:ADP-ribose pyrophosphatase YjhB (NUDIX family)